MKNRLTSFNRPHVLARKLICFVLLGLTACHHHHAEGPAQFEIIDAKSTGLHFSNTLKPTQQFNVFKYMYFYNGAGVGVGDFNNDGKIDIFFAANQEKNRLFLNEGNLQFKDVTEEAKIPEDGAWSTGVSVIDINNDGLLDLYICRVGNHETLHSHNQLLICKGIDAQGVPFYEDQAKSYGLDFSGFSTQAVFFDYDMDGDLDMYLLNHSIHQNGTFGRRAEKLTTYSPVSGDHLYRNEGGGKFTDVTKASGIHSSVIGYGLGIAAADIDLDGYPDLYVGNDFHENDYLYINQHDGTFKDDLNERMMHTSQFSMGVDVADINNDAFPEVMTVDMLPSDPYVLKRSEGEDTYDIFNMKLSYGYNHQYTRNNLQFNRKNGKFSEVGLYAGVYATDWSWCPLWFDFDNDGLKDLFVSNGIPKRLNDIDYINFISNEDLQDKLRNDGLDKKDMAMVEKFPQIKIENKFFRNKGDLIFDDIAGEIDNDKKTYSNGAVYADFDNDGDLDVLANCIDEDALLYKNTSEQRGKNTYVSIKLHGTSQNVNALGAKVILFAKDGIRTYEKYPVRGFLSSAETPIHVGLKNTVVDSCFLIWPDNSCQRIKLTPDSPSMQFTYRPGLPKFNYQRLAEFQTVPVKQVKDVTAETKLLYNHEENNFHEFDREPLIPHMLSTEGPALTVGDLNHDGLEDVFIGASKWKQGIVFLQQPSGTFQRMAEPDLAKDSADEDVDACIVDVNHDGFPDLIVASGGNEFYGHDIHLTPRVYLNDGIGHLSKKQNAFDSLFVNASSVVSCDVNGDGYPDLFIGGRSVPFNYGQIPQSYLLINDGTGKFTDATSKYSAELAHIGFVTKAIWFDLDKDGKQDLIVSLEWGGIFAFMNRGNAFEKRVITDKKGWWNFMLPVDIDGDGKTDFIAGNLGLNSRLHASVTEPVRLYYYDFDENGKKSQVMTYYLGGRELPFANITELEKQMPKLRRKFLFAEDFAKASLTDLFSKSKLEKADQLTADYFSNAIIMNRGDGSFETKAMPWKAQLSSYRDAVVVDANGDSLPDILLVGNYYENNIQMGRYDADFGTLLLNQGHGVMTAESLNGLQLTGQIRHIQKVHVGKKEDYILAKNNDSTRVIQFSDAMENINLKTISEPK